MPNALLTEKNTLQVKAILISTLLVKCLLLIVFSSAYKDQLFIPFVYQFLELGGNPWDGALEQGGLEFPYPPSMLYILSIVLAPVKWLGLQGTVVESLMFGLPILASDALIFLALIQLFPWRKTEIYIFYFASPIILFSSYMHGQLDLIPTALIFYSLKCVVDKNYLKVGLLLGAAITTKFHTVAIIPLILIYLLNKKLYREALIILILPALIYAVIVFPYICSDGYQSLVMQGEKQRLVFDTYFKISDLKIYLPILAALFLYMRMLAFQKVNHDLLFAMSGSLFSVFLLLIEPAPGWFVWIVPFFTVFYIRYFNGYLNYFYYISLTVLYLAYYLLFYNYEHSPLSFLGYEIIAQTPFSGGNLNNLAFTVLEALMVASIFHFYRSGISSNQVYAMEEAFVFGIGGDSSSGKTTLLKSLSHLFGKELLQLEGDGDHKWERGDENWENFTHLNPKANLLHKQAGQIALLKGRNKVRRSDYNHNTGTFTDQETLHPKNFLVIAGLHPFYLPKMRKVIDLKIFLDLDEGLRTAWKLKRDVADRGHEIDKVLKNIEDRKQDAEKYIRPQKNFADVVIRYFPLVENDSLICDESDGADRLESLELERAIGLEIALDASVPLQGFLSLLENRGIAVEWDYSEDLQHQIIRLLSEPEIINYNELTAQYITNAHELVSDPHWQAGYKGVVQFIILLIVSETLKDKAAHNG